jgi:ABC-type branched-subunit amino acid transport system ATPase component
MTQEPLSATSRSPALEVRQLSHSFKGLRALTDVSFSVFAGEIVGVLGPNGSGKSTLFDVVTGVYPAQKGETLFHGKTISKLSPAEIAKSGLVRSFQTTRTFPDLTVVEHILTSLGACLPMSESKSWAAHFRATRKFRQEAIELLHYVGLSDRANEMAMRLPYGSRRLLDICRCLSMQPTVMMLGEPAAGLTQDERNELVALLKQIVHERMIALVIVEHDLALVRGICTGVVALNEGMVIARGGPQLVYDNVDFRNAYLGKEAT